MDPYKIIVTPDATANLAELRYYIANILMAPGTARKYIRLIRREIAGQNSPCRRRTIAFPWNPVFDSQEFLCLLQD